MTRSRATQGSKLTPSEQQRAYWAAMSPEERKARKAESARKQKAYAASLSEEQKEETNRKRSETMKRCWASRTSEQKAAIARKTSEGQTEDVKQRKNAKLVKTWKRKSKASCEQHRANVVKAFAQQSGKKKRLHKKRKAVSAKKFWDNLRENDPEEFARRSRMNSECQVAAFEALSPEEQEAFCRKRSEQAKAWWDGLSEEEREQEGIKRYEGLERRCAEVGDGIRDWYHITPKGRWVWVQSTWEANAANALEAVRLRFRRSPCLHHAGGLWHPDFFVNNSLIFEVKGHPLAFERFNTVHLPHLLTLPDNFKAAIAIMDFDPKNKRYTDYRQLLRDLSWVHAPAHLAVYWCHVKRWYSRECFERAPSFMKRGGYHA